MTTLSGNQADYVFSREDGKLVIKLKQGGAVVSESADNFTAQFSDGTSVDLSQSFAHLAATSDDFYLSTPASTALAGGGYVLLWESYNQADETGGITLQQYDVSGKLVKETQLASGEAGDSSITATANGGYIATWSTDTAIKFQQFNSDGNTKGSAQTVATSSTAELWDAVISTLPNGSFVVSWISAVEKHLNTNDQALDMSDDEMDGQYSDVTGDLYLQTYSASGSKLGGVQKVNSDTIANSTPNNQVILSLGDNGFLVAYTHETTSYSFDQWGNLTSPTQSDFYVRQFNANGSPKDTEPQKLHNLETYYPNASYYSLIKAADGFLATWVADANDGVNLSRTLFVQKFNAQLEVDGSPEAVIPASQTSANDASLTLLDNGKFLAVWSTYTGDQPNATYAQLLNTDLSPTSEPFTVRDSSGPSYEAEVTALKEGGFVITWSSGDSDTANASGNIYSQRYDAAGNTTRDASTVITGDELDNTLTWIGENAVTIQGLAGDDTLQGGTGNDILDGGLGDDTVIVTGTQDGYSFSQANGNLQITGTNDQDSLISIEKIQFSDGSSITIDDGSFPLESNSQIDSETPAITTLGDGSQVIVWKETDGLHIQRYDGKTLLGTTLVANSTDAIEPLIAVLGNGFIVSWSQNYEGPQASSLSSQHFTAGGVASSEVTTFAPVNSNWDIWDPSFTELTNGDYVMAWTEEEESNPQTGYEGVDKAYAQVFGANGQAKGGPIAIGAGSDILATAEPSVAALQNGGFVVAWEREDSSENEEIYLQRFKADGSADGKAIQVNTGTKGDQGDPAVAVLNDGSYVVTWTRETDKDIKVNGEIQEVIDTCNIFMQRFSAAGAKLGTEAQVNSTSSIYNDPVITALKGEGAGYVVSWATSDEHEGGAYNGSSTLYAQIFDKNGVKVGTELTVSHSADQDYFPTIAATNDGGFLVAWEAAGRNGSNGDINAKRFDASGNSLILTGDDNDNTITWTGTTDITLSGGAGNDTLTGGTGKDVLVGGDGDDRLNGGAGADYMAGGAGNDIYVVDNAKDQVFEKAGEGIDTVDSSITWTLGNSLENLTLTGTAAINGTGNELDNIITGNAGNNILNGGAGDDKFYGGAGNDTLNGGDGDDTLVGGAGIDKLAGGKGNDTYIVDMIAKGKGASATLALQDSITEKAGEGDDTLVLLIDDETRLLMSGASKASTVTLAATLEHLDASETGDIDINLTGHKNAKSLTGNAGANILDAKGGAAELTGLDGNDTYVIYSEEDLARVAEAENEGNDTLQIAFKSTAAKGERTVIDLAAASNIENINITGAGMFALIGTEEDNRLSGNNSGTLMSGGLGDDTYVLNHKNDLITEDAGAGNDTIETAKLSIDLNNYANVENVTLTGKAALNATGNDQANTLTGNDGNNILDGGLNTISFDILRGGKGNDTYIVRNESDVVEEHYNEGIDTVKAAVDHILGANIENLILTGDATEGTGNDLANTITGNDGNNILDGGKGVDKLIGGKGSDTYIVDLVLKGIGAKATVVLEDIIVEGVNGGYHDTLKLRADSLPDDFSGTASITLGANLEALYAMDTGKLKLNLTGNALNNVLVGNEGDNVINGGAGDDDILAGDGGNNTLIGGAGADTMSGGSGKDTFAFTSLKDLGLGEGKQDVIYNFASGIDKLDFSALKGYTLVNKDSFGSVAKQLHWETKQDDEGGGDYVMVYGNTDKDAAAEFSIKLIGISELTAADFTL